MGSHELVRRGLYVHKKLSKTYVTTGVGQKDQFWLTQSGMQDKDTQRENEMVKETIKGIRIPPAPPGQHWQKFEEEDAGVWWYYEGPLGKWWIPVGEAEIEPYPV
jgi:hypothetical protein